MSQSPNENKISEVPHEHHNSEPLPGLLGDVQSSWKLFLDPRVPAAVKLLPFLLAAVYFFFPADILPDPLLGAGQVDDLGILVVALVLFRIIAPSYISRGDQSSQALSHTAMAASIEEARAVNEDDDSGRETPPRSPQPRSDYRPPPGLPPAAPVHVTVKGQSSCSTIVLVVLLIILIVLVVVLMTGIKTIDLIKNIIPKWILSDLLGVGPTPAPPLPTPTFTPSATPTPSIYIQLVTVGKLEVLHHTAQMVIEQKRPDCALGEERLLYVAHGEAIMGIDLKGLKEKDIMLDGKRVVLRLPPVKVLHAFLDVDESRVYDYQKPIVYLIFQGAQVSKFSGYCCSLP